MPGFPPSSRPRPTRSLRLQLTRHLCGLGKVKEGLILHPDNEHIIFPLGTTIVVRHIISRTQEFLRGHDNEVSVIVVSNTGKYIASGQRTYQGFQVSRKARRKRNGRPNLNCLLLTHVSLTGLFSVLRLISSSGTSTLCKSCSA